MSYMMRDRPDGQFEIVLTRTSLVGIFPERQIASKVMFFLREEEIELPDDAPAMFGRADDDVAEAEELILVEPEERSVANTRTTLPAVVRPPSVGLVKAPAPGLTEEQTNAAFARLTNGEKIALVAPDFGLTTFQLRGQWAAYRQKLQKHLAEGGSVPCAMCGKKFIRSLSQWDTCARCSRD